MVRMDSATYTFLLRMLEPALQKQRTRMRQPISPAVRLAVTMRFLAFGEINVNKIKNKNRKVQEKII